MPDIDQDQYVDHQYADQGQDQQYQLTGDQLSEMHGLAQQLDAANDPRAQRIWDFIQGQTDGGDGNQRPQFTMTQAPPKVTSWLEDLENDLWGSKDESANGESDEPAGAQAGSDFDGIGKDDSATGMLLENGTENATSGPESAQSPADASADSEKDSLAIQPKTAPGPAESDPVAWKAFMEGLDSHKVGNYTVGELANVLTNESRDLSFVGPSVSIFDNDLDRAKYVQAHAILNNAMLTKPNAMANRTVSKAAAASPGHPRDIAIMRQAYFDRMAQGADPAQGRTYFGNSAELLNSSRIGNSRHTVFARFGPFRLGTQKPRYIYIYNDPIQKKQP